MKIHLLAIDCQNDFASPNGALFVPGADADITRLANLVNRLQSKIDDIHVTLDSHQQVDIAHPIFWVNSKGEHPAPFTIISKDDVANGVWTTTSPACAKRAFDYVKQLDANQRYPLCIWPPHCVIGSWGTSLVPEFDQAIGDWAKARFKTVDYQVKGSNPFTEHYSAVQADVIDPKDPSTALNKDLLQVIAQADEILIAGEALSHCVNFTVTDIADNFGEENVSKFVFLEDAASSVPTFEQNGEDFLTAMKARGMRVTTTTDYLA